MIYSTIFNHSSHIMYSTDEKASRGKEGETIHHPFFSRSSVWRALHGDRMGVRRDSFTPDDTCSVMPHYSSELDDHTSNSTKFSTRTHFSFSSSSSSPPPLKLADDFCSVQAQVVDSGTSSCPCDKSLCQRHEECLNRCI